MKYKLTWLAVLAVYAVIAARMANSLTQGVMIFLVLSVPSAVSAWLLIRKRAKQR